VLLWEVLCAVSGCCARGAGAELGLLWAGHRVGPALSFCTQSQLSVFSFMPVFVRDRFCIYIVGT